MRVLNQPDDITERIRNCSNPNIATDILDVSDYSRTRFPEVSKSTFNIRNSPVRDATAWTHSRLRSIRIEPKLEAADVESNIERLIEIRLHTKCFCIPRFRAREIRH